MWTINQEEFEYMEEWEPEENSKFFKINAELVVKEANEKGITPVILHPYAWIDDDEEKWYLLEVVDEIIGIENFSNNHDMDFIKWVD